MKNIRIILASILLALAFGEAYPQEVAYKVFLVGDAGKDTAAGPALALMGEALAKEPNSTVIFLGDNVYYQGLEHNKRKFPVSEKKLLSQLNLLDNYKGKVFIIPGNHDWKAGKWKGKRAILFQGEYVEKYLDKTTVANKEEPNFVPALGLPGPYSVLLRDSLRLIAIDSQWWLQKQFFHPVGIEGSKRKTKKLFYQRLDSLMAEAAKNGEKVIIAGHHPVFTVGEHGQNKQPLRFFINYTPVQGVGLLGLNRWLVQDINQPRYKRLNRNLVSKIERHPDVIHVAGHEHNIQYYKKGASRFIISGAGSKFSSCKASGACNYFQDKQTGFVALTYYKDGSIGIEAVMGDGTVAKIE
jgi:predicted phosphodiesterase